MRDRLPRPRAAWALAILLAQGCGSDLGNDVPQAVTTSPNVGAVQPDLHTPARGFGCGPTPAACS